MLMEGQKQNYHIKIIARPGHDEMCYLAYLTPFFHDVSWTWYWTVLSAIWLGVVSCYIETDHEYVMLEQIYGYLY
jgi:hypothetical protein